MARALQYLSQTSFRGGINQEPSSAKSNQLLDARNVYINDRGDLVKRPGSRIIDWPFNTAPTDQSDPPGSVIRIGTTNVTTTGVNIVPLLDALAPFDYWYFGASEVLTSPRVNIAHRTGSFQTLTVTPPVTFTLEYWNGTAWQEINAGIQEDDRFATYIGLGTPNRSSLRLILAYLPTDHALSTIGGLDRYWYRVRLIGPAATFSGTVSTVTDVLRSADPAANIAGLFSARINDEVQTVYVVSYLNENTIFYKSEWDTYDFFEINSSVVEEEEGPAPTFAVIPEFSKIYVAYNHRIFDLSKDTPNANGDYRAQVNSDINIVGDEDGVQETDARYDKDTVAQLTEFPAANLITYFKGFLWAAGIKDEPFTVRWSGPALDGAYDLWPSTSFEVLSQDDNSPITGLAALNEHLVVFKQDSIWLMVFSGFAPDTLLAQFAPVKVVSGIGTVAGGSIQLINGRLIFLAEDGFYAFDGTPNIRKLSDSIDEEVRKINPAFKAFATATHWSTNSLYMCSVVTGSSALPNLVFVFDYKNNGWWFWEGLTVKTWLKEVTSSSKERISFGDNKGRIFLLDGNARTDSGKPIRATVLPHRLGYGDNLTKRWRDYRIYGSNSTVSTTLNVLRYDEETTDAPVLLTDATEAKFDDAVWDTDKWVKDKRRERHIRIRHTSEWIQPALTHDTADEFELHGFSVGYTPVGVR